MKTRTTKAERTAEMLRDRDATYQALLILRDGSEPDTFALLAGKLERLNAKLVALGALPGGA